MIEPNPYCGTGLNRVGELRDDPDWLDAALAESASRIWLMHGERHLTRLSTAQPLYVEAGSARDFLHLLEPLVALGVDADGVAEFAAGVSAPALAALAELLDAEEDGLQEADLRTIGPRLSRPLAARLAYTRGILGWHSRHAFCPACGQPTRSAGAGHRRQCEGQSCASVHFPRTDPAVIMLVENGDHCLLGRQPHWPQGMQSVLAGFVEPGESLEEAVAREVWEEAGIAVADITYHSSQPWPFPASIMLGFRAHALTGRLNPRDHELESIRWYHRDELLACPENERFRLPRVDSIARRLVNDWLQR